MSNSLYYGDNLDVLRRKIRDETVDLCYIDPPFNSKRTYNQIYNNFGQEDKAQAQAFIDTWKWDDHSNSGLAQIFDNTHGLYPSQCIELINGLLKVLRKGSMLAYLVNMTLRIAEIHRVLKPSGTFFLHCDPTASHYLKLILDTIFVSQGGEFQNEIIWCYSIGGKSSKRFAEKHDVILFYTKSNDDTHTFNRQGAIIPRKPNSHMKVRSTADGRLYQEKTDKKSGKVYRYFLDDGKIAEDWWIDIETLNRGDSERLGYPTQKPERLLERIIGTFSNEGDCIFDAYCGCGTTINVAQRLERKWIGIDITYQSIGLILRRLEDSFGTQSVTNIQLSGVPRDMDGARALANKKDDRTRKEFEKWAVLTFSNNRAVINDKKGADHGIDGKAFVQESMNNQRPIVFSVKSGHNLNVSMVRDLHGVIAREDAAAGILITLEPPTKPMSHEAKAAGTYQNPYMSNPFDRIQLVSVESILQGERLRLPLTHEVLKRAETYSAGENLSFGL
ncbi:MAG: restriction endonuclease [Chloroflexi bacterium]|nr:restriction endonuclease [Chloroflexota bacterium]